MTAMAVAKPEIVVALLNAGAKTDFKSSLDPFMYAAMFGNVNNMKTWDSKVKHDVDRRNEEGSTALHCAVHFGRNKMETVSYLIQDRKADVKIVNNSGENAVTLACSNVDSDPNVVTYLLKQPNVDISYRVKSQSTALKFTKLVSHSLDALGMRSKDSSDISISSGCTALHYAVRRGDLGVTEILLENGADITSKDDMGTTVFEYAREFPKIKRSMWRVQKVCHSPHSNSKASGKMSKMASTVGTYLLAHLFVYFFFFQHTHTRTHRCKSRELHASTKNINSHPHQV